MLKQMVAEGAQFIIATHSAMLMAFPGASIISFDRYPVVQVPYDEVEQISLLRDFLQNPQVFLRHL
jgi:predicted ATPase